MNNYPKLIKRKLDVCIQNLISMRHTFVNDPEKDFIRNRKITMKGLIEILITMGAGSQTKELLKYFKFDVNALKWKQGPEMKHSRFKPGSLLSRDGATLFVFGGCD